MNGVIILPDATSCDKIVINKDRKSRFWHLLHMHKGVPEMSIMMSEERGIIFLPA